MNHIRLITVITPTADRPEWLKRAIGCFLAQTWPEREMLILDNGREGCKEIIPVSAGVHYWCSAGKMTLGEKLNWLCERAAGEIIVRFDDDDWSGPERIASQVQDLDSHKADLVGYHQLYYYDTRARKAFRYDYPAPKMYAPGLTQCFLKSFWRQNPYPSKDIGEDTAFSNAARAQGRLWSCAGGDLFVARVHGKNSSCHAHYLPLRHCFSAVPLENLPGQFRAQEL